jgi:hypothetical protein
LPNKDGKVFDWESFQAEGFRLAQMLKNHLGADVYVEFDWKPVPFTGKTI